MGKEEEEEEESRAAQQRRGWRGLITAEILSFGGQHIVQDEKRRGE